METETGGTVVEGVEVDAGNIGGDGTSTNGRIGTGETETAGTGETEDVTRGVIGIERGSTTGGTEAERRAAEIGRSEETETEGIAGSIIGGTGWWDCRAGKTGGSTKGRAVTGGEIRWRT